MDMYEPGRGRDDSIPAECRTPDVALRTNKYIRWHIQTKDSAVSEITFCFIKWKYVKL